MTLKKLDSLRHPQNHFRRLFFILLFIKGFEVFGQCDFTWIQQNPCPGETVTFSVTNPQGNHVYTFLFSNPDMPPKQGNTVTASFPLNTSAQSYTVTLLDSLGNQELCSSNQQIQVKPAPDLAISLVPQPGVSFQNNIIATCDSLPAGGLEIKIRNTTPAGTVGQNVNYQFDWGDGSGVQNFTNATFSGGIPVAHTYSGQGSFPIKITVTHQNGCTWVYQYEFYSGSNPSVGLGTPGNTINLCPPAKLTFPVYSVAGNSPGTQYLFQVNGVTVLTFNQSNIPASIMYTFTESSCGKGNAQSPNAYYVKIIAQNPCGSSEAQVGPITVSEAPVAVIGMTMPPNFCPGAMVTFTNLSWGGAAVIQTSPGVFSCDSITEQVEWVISPGINGVDFQYNINDIYNQSIKVTFLKTGTYTIKMKVLNQNSTCGVSMAVKTIVIAELPIAQADVVPQGADDCAPKTIQFFNKSLNSTSPPAWSVIPATGWHFQNPSTSSSENPVIVFDTAGTYKITLKITNPCGMDTWDTTIVVNTKPKITGFVPPGPCEGDPLIFSPANIAFQTGGLPCTCTYQIPGFLNVTIPCNQATPPVSLPGIGPYPATLTVTNACGAVSQTANVNFAKKPVPAFYMPAQICLPAPLTCSDSSQTFTAPTYRKWTLRDAAGNVIATSMLPNASFTLSTVGQYTVELEIGNACDTLSTTKTVDVFASPTVSPATDNNEPCGSGFPVLTLMHTDGGAPDSVSWQCPGGTPPAATGVTPPAPFYGQPGTYIITVTADNMKCPSATASVQFTVADIPTADVTVAPRPQCLPAGGYTIPFNLTAKPGVNYLWTITRTDDGTNPPNPFTFVNGTSGTSASPFVHIDACGIYTYELSAWNHCDTAAWTLTDTFYTKAGAVLPQFPNAFCQQALPDLSGTAYDFGCEPAVTVAWSSPLGQVLSTELYPSDIQFSSPAMPQAFTLYLTIDGVCGSTTVSTSIQVDAPEALILGPNPLVLCKNNAPVSLTTNLPGGQWYLNGQTVSPVINPAGLAADQYTFVYRKGSGACISEDSVAVTIYDLPAAVAGNNVAVCVEKGFVVLSPALSPGSTGVWSSSNPGVTFSGDTAFFTSVLTSTLTFKATDNITGCTNTSVLLFDVIPNTPLAVPPVFVLCNTPGPVLLPLTTNNPKLLFSGPGVTPDGKHFDPSLPGVDTANVLNWTNENAAGCIASGTMTVNLIELLAPGVLDAGPPVVLCQNGGLFIRDGLPAGLPGLIWLDSLGNPISTAGALTIDPSVYQQDFFLKVILSHGYNSPNCRQDDTLLLHIVYAAPDAGPDIVKCQNDPPFPLVAVNMAPPGFAAYWTPSDTIDPAAGNQAATLHFEGSGCGFTDDVAVIVEGLPGSAFSIVAPYCIGEVIDFQNNTVNAVSQQWLDNGNFLSFDADPQGKTLSAGPHIIRLESTTSAGCHDAFEDSIYVESPPTISCTPDIMTGCGPLPVTFTYTTTAADTLFFEVRLGNAVLFAAPATGSPQTLTLPDTTLNLTYSVALVAGNECATTESVSDILVKAQAIAGYGFNQDTFCNGEILKLLSKSLNSVADTFLVGTLKVPTSITQTESFTLLNPTENPIVLTVCLLSENECNKDSFCHDIIILPANYEALAETNTDLSKICEGDSVLLTGHATAGATTYWKNKSGTVLTGNTVWVKAGNGVNEWVFFATGCGYDTDTVVFFGKQAPPLTAVFVTDACVGVEHEISATSVDAVTRIIFAPGDTVFGGSATRIFQNPGIVPFTVTAVSATTGCTTHLDTSLTVRPLPPIPLHLTESCTQAEGYLLEITDSPGAEIRVTRDSVYDMNGDKHPHLQSGLYRIHLVENVYGCPNDTTVFVPNVREVTAEAFPEDTTEIQLGQTVDLFAQGEYAVSFLWSRPQWLSDATSTEPVAEPGATGCFDFVVTATDDRNCKAADTVWICVRNHKIVVAFPKAFTPNGDGVNDVLFPRSINPGVVKMEFRVYDKWDEQVFVAAGDCLPNNPDCGWDGTFRGQKAQMGNYRAHVVFTYLDGETSTHIRMVRLIR